MPTQWLTYTYQVKERIGEGKIPTANRMQNTRITFITLNVRGINNQFKRRKIFRWIHDNNVDIAFLQETFSVKENEKQWTTEWGGQILYSHGSPHSKGVMILFNPKLSIEIENREADEDGRYILNCKHQNE